MSLKKNNSSILTSESPKTTGKVVRFSFNYDLKNLFLDVVNEKDRHLYEEFICKIRDLGQEIRDDELIQILKEARNCISILDRNLILFVQVILLLKWSHRSEDVVQEYQGFLLDLCSAHSYYTKNVLEHLVTYFKCVQSDFVNGLPDDDELINYQNIHNVIKSILSVIPMSSELIINTLNSFSPYIKRPSNENACYLYNILQIITYSPTFRYDIFKIVTQKIVSMDVTAPKDLIENDLLKTLDLSMNVLLTFIKNSCYDNSDNLKFQTTKLIYNDLLKVFESTLLNTHGTCYVQFVIFYVLSLKPIFTVGFLQHLWNKVTNPNVAHVIRQASVSYISGLLSRAKYIPINLVKDILSEMSPFVHSYIASQESVVCVSHDTRIHGVFYAVCQAIFYVIAFRHKELIDSKKGVLFLNGLNLTKIVQCRLNPLKLCQPVIARNFANVTRAYQLVYCYSILERNARSSLPQLSRDSSGNETILQQSLETFFPFDPYCLPISCNFIKSIYREYSEDIPCDSTETPSNPTDNLDEPMQQDEEDDFLDPNMILSQSPQVSSMQYLLSQSPKESLFAYRNHPGFLHIT